MNEFLKVNWDPNMVNKVFTIETEEKARDDEERKLIFKNTHIPINKIKIENACPEFFSLTNKKVFEFIDEETLFRYLEKYPENEKRVIIIKGGVGSGKSELAESINYKFLDHKNVIPLIFPRSEVNLRDIFDKINKKFKMNLRYKSLLDYEIRTIVDYILNQSDMLIQDLKKDNSEILQELIRNQNSKLILYKLLSRSDYNKKIKEFLKSSIENYINEIQSHGDLGVEFELKEDFENFIIKEFHQENIEVIKKDIELIFEKVIHDYQEIPSFNQIVEDIYNRTESGKRVLFIFEDATGFGFAENLINFAFDRKLKPCDIVIAWTDGYIDDRGLERTNYRQRTQLVLSLSDNKKSFFLNDENILEMARRYLNTLKMLSKDSLEESNLIDFERIEKIFDGFYPFNRNALVRIYQNLIYEGQQKQTPRIFLAYALRSILFNKEIPELNESPNFKVPSGYAPISLENEFPHFFSIVYLYGEPTDERKLEIDYEILEVLGSTISKEFKKELASIISTNNNKVCINLKRSLKKLKILKDPNHKTSKSKEANKDENDGIEEEYDLAVEDFHNWLRGNKLAKRKEMEKGLNSLLDFFSNKKFTVFEPFSYSKIFIDTDIEQQTRPELRLLISKENRADHVNLEICLFDIGVLDHELSNLINEEKFNLMNSKIWVENLKLQLEKNFFEKLNSSLNINFNKLIILLKAFSLFLIKNKLEIDYFDLIKEKYVSESLKKSLFRNCPRCNTELDLKQNSFSCPRCKFIINPTIPQKYLDEIDNYFTTVDMIFDVLFKISDDFYDFIKLDGYFNELSNSEEYLVMNINIFNDLSNIRNISDERMYIHLSSSKSLQIKQFIEKTKEIISRLVDELNAYNLRKYYIDNTTNFLNNFKDIIFDKSQLNEIKNGIKEIQEIPILKTYNLIQNFNFSVLNEDFNEQFQMIDKKWTDFVKNSHKLNFFKINNVFWELNKFYSKCFDTYKELEKVLYCENYLEEYLSKKRTENQELTKKIESFNKSEENCIHKLNTLREAIKDE